MATGYDFPSGMGKVAPLALKGCGITDLRDEPEARRHRQLVDISVEQVFCLADYSKYLMR